MTATAPGAPLSVREPVVLDDGIRGVPPGLSGVDGATVAALGWHPAEGAMALPVLTLDEAVFLSNRDLFLAYAREQGVAVAPHAKTPMAPDLARALVEGGAWGVTVADIRQTAVMLRAGIRRLILANEVGGHGGARRLSTLLAAHPQAEMLVFADSVEAVEALGEAWAATPALSPLAVLAEVGAGRAGARTLDKAEAVIEAILASPRLRLAGIAAYEGAAAKATAEETDAAIAGVLALAGAAFEIARARVGAGVPLVVTAGGSVFFDRVVATLGPLAAADGAATLVLRSGAIFFHDHGVYDRALAALDARGGFSLGGRTVAARNAFRPALRLWAEVLSRPEPDLAVCGMGMRDVSFDQGLPTPLAVHRGGRRLDGVSAAVVTKLNDQHAFLALAAGADLRVGDVVEFGISHPCTCLDRYRVVFGVDAAGRVAHAFPTAFG